MTRSLTCALVLVATLAAVETWFRFSDLRRRLDTEETFIAMVTHLAAAPRDPEVAVIGDSRIRHGVDTAVIERLVKRHAHKSIAAWNLGAGGMIGTSQLAMTLRVLDRPRPPKLVILYVDPTGFLSYTRPELAYEILTKPWRLWDVPSLVRAGASAEELLEIALSTQLETMRHRGRVLDVLLHNAEPETAEEPTHHGFFRMRPADGAHQHRHAVKRGMSYRKRYDGPSSGYRLSDFKLGSLREALRRCREAGVRAVMIASPATSTVRTMASGPRTIVPRFERAMNAIAKDAGVRYLDHASPPVVSDDNYTDGDHMDWIGAARYTTWLAHEVVLPMAYGVKKAFTRWDVPRPSPGCKIVFDFEEREDAGWTKSGKTVAELLASGRRGMQARVTGFKGLGLLSTWHRKRGAAAEGEATSPSFAIGRKRIQLLVGGGAKGVSVELVVDGEAVRSARGADANKLAKVTWDVSALVGSAARLRVTDTARDRWGYLLLDQVEQCD